MGCGGGEAEDEHWGSIDVPRAVQEAISIWAASRRKRAAGDVVWASHNE
jgi:hypothetical protein